MSYDYKDLVHAVTKFSVGNLGMIFDILRTKIYKDPITAICREISCNARDAHREVGTPDRPIEIHLPTADNPYIEFHDFGPGISPDRMENVFTKYATSTKKDDKIQTGEFGLGCKSPFAYSDRFSIITVVDGIRREYDAIIDSTKVGQITLKRETETDDPNGTVIIIQVKPGDEPRFIARLRDVTQFWDIKPKFFSSGNVFNQKYIKHEYILRGTNWGFLKDHKDTYGYNAQIQTIANVDGIQYPISLDSIDSLDYSDKALFRRSFVIDFGIGDLTLAASRDNIHYDEKTKATIQNRLDQIREDIPDIVFESINDCLSYSDACRKFEHLPNAIRKLAGKNVKWEGHALIDSLYVSEIGDFAKVTTYIREGAGITTKRKHSRLLFTASHKTTAIYHNDRTNERAPTKVVRHIFDLDENLKTVQVVSTPEKPTHAAYVNAKALNKDVDVSYDLDLLYLIGAKKLSGVKVPKEIKVKTSKPKVKRAKNLLRGYAISLYDYSMKREPADLERDGSGVYVIVDYKYNDYYVSETSTAGLSGIQSLMGVIGGDVKLYGVTQAKKDKLGSGWVLLKDAAMKTFEEKYKGKIDEKELKQLVDSTNWLENIRFDNNMLRYLAKHLDESNVISQYVKESDSVKKKIDDAKPYMEGLAMFYKKYYKTCNYSGYALDNVGMDSKLYSLCQTIRDRYPLLKALQYKFSTYLDDIIEYITLVDNKKAYSQKQEQAEEYDINTTLMSTQSFADGAAGVC
jgi:hypothetical protein